MQKNQRATMSRVGDAKTMEQPPPSYSPEDEHNALPFYVPLDVVTPNGRTDPQEDAPPPPYAEIYPESTGFGAPVSYAQPVVVDYYEARQQAIARMDASPFVETYRCHFFISCIAFLLCGFVIGGIAFILAVLAKVSASNGQTTNARQLGLWSLFMSVMSIALGCFAWGYIIWYSMVNVS